MRSSPNMVYDWIMEGFVNWLLANQWAYILIFAWDISWRLLAMWHAARQNQKIWFVALLLINSVGLLPLIYLVFVSKKKFWVKESPVLNEIKVIKKK